MASIMFAICMWSNYTSPVCVHGNIALMIAYNRPVQYLMMDPSHSLESHMQLAFDYIDTCLLPGTRWGSSFHILGLRDYCAVEEVMFRNRVLGRSFHADQLLNKYTSYLATHKLHQTDEDYCVGSVLM